MKGDERQWRTENREQRDGEEHGGENPPEQFLMP